MNDSSCSESEQTSEETNGGPPWNRCARLKGKTETARGKRKNSVYSARYDSATWMRGEMNQEKTEKKKTEKKTARTRRGYCWCFSSEEISSLASLRCTKTSHLSDAKARHAFEAGNDLSGRLVHPMCSHNSFSKKRLATCEVLFQFKYIKKSSSLAIIVTMALRHAWAKWLRKTRRTRIVYLLTSANEML